MLRLHCAGFTQGSWYVRNVLRQPGPLSLPPNERSSSTPSFRVIDFGRGESAKCIMEGTKISSQSHANTQNDPAYQWDMTVVAEDKNALRELEIPDWDY